MGMEKWFQKRGIVPQACNWGLVSVGLIVPYAYRLGVEVKKNLNTFPFFNSLKHLWFV